MPRLAGGLVIASAYRLSALPSSGYLSGAAERQHRVVRTGAARACRRYLAASLAFLLCFAAHVQPTQAATDREADGCPGSPLALPPLIAVLEFELAGDLGDAALAPQQERRRHMATQVLREEIAQTLLYRVTDNSAAAELISGLSTLEYLHACHGCEFVIAERLGADHVLIPWVYRVSNLVLTLNVEIKDVSTQRLVVKRSLDFRGDNDVAWLKAVRFLLRDIKAWAEQACAKSSTPQREESGTATH